MTDLIAKHGGYRNLKSFQSAEIVFDLTFEFCRKFVKSFKMREQMEGAARGGKQNIIEGSANAGTSKQTELRLLNVARGSQEELKGDLEDFLRVNGFSLWSKDDPRVLKIRNLAHKSDRSKETYKSYLEEPESGANALLCLVNQTNFLLDKQIGSLEREFKIEGDFADRKRQIIKERIVGDDSAEYEKILKDAGFKRLVDGRVVPIDSEEK